MAKILFSAVIASLCLCTAFALIVSIPTTLSPSLLTSGRNGRSGAASVTGTGIGSIFGGGVGGRLLGGLGGGGGGGFVGGLLSGLGGGPGGGFGAAGGLGGGLGAAGGAVIGGNEAQATAVLNQPPILRAAQSDVTKLASDLAAQGQTAASARTQNLANQIQTTLTAVQKRRKTRSLTNSGALNIDGYGISTAFTHAGSVSTDSGLG